MKKQNDAAGIVDRLETEYRKSVEALRTALKQFLDGGPPPDPAQRPVVPATIRSSGDLQESAMPSPISIRVALRGVRRRPAVQEGLQGVPQGLDALAVFHFQPIDDAGCITLLFHRCLYSGPACVWGGASTVGVEPLTAAPGFT